MAKKRGWRENNGTVLAKPIKRKLPKYRLGKYHAYKGTHKEEMGFVGQLTAFVPRCPHRIKSCRGCSGRLLFSINNKPVSVLVQGEMQETVCGYKKDRAEKLYEEVEKPVDNEMPF